MSEEGNKNPRKEGSATGLSLPLDLAGLAATTVMNSIRVTIEVTVGSVQGLPVRHTTGAGY
jgi:hypothetical protein